MLFLLQRVSFFKINIAGEEPGDFSKGVQIIFLGTCISHPPPSPQTLAESATVVPVYLSFEMLRGDLD